MGRDEELESKRMVGDLELTNLIEYTLIFHLGAESGMASVTKVHGALTAQLEISYTDQYFMNEELDGTIGASFLLCTYAGFGPCGSV